MKTRSEISVAVDEKIKEIIHKLEAMGIKADELSEQLDREQRGDVTNISRHHLESLYLEIKIIEENTQKLSHTRDGLYKIKKFCELDAIGLNLSNTQLEDIPIELWDLPNLQFLDLSKNNITNLSTRIGQLSDLIELDLSNNHITSLPAELGKLSRLQKLTINANQLKILPIEIGNLTLLESLVLDGNQLSSLPGSIAQLHNLKLLDLYSNKFKEIQSEIFQLSNLSKLHIGNNKIKKISSEIQNLMNLEELLLSETRITDLPVEIKELKKLKLLNLRGANLLHIPPEILDKVNQPDFILDYYFSNIRNKKAISQAKIILVGQGAIGKTSLVRQLAQGNFDPSETKTEGISITQWQVSNKSKNKNQQSKIQLNIWDFGGQEIMHSTHQFFLTTRSIYLLVLDNRLTPEENRLEYWLKIIQSFGGESPILIIGNKSDQHPLDIDRSRTKKKYPNIFDFLETSAATGAGIAILKTTIAKMVNDLPHVHDLVPDTWIKVKARFEELGRTKSFITQEKYLEICTENNVIDEANQRTLIGFLHDLGVVLHFQDDPRLESLGILNPQWVTKGVYKIINSEILFRSLGVLTILMLNDILNFPEYPRDKRIFIVDMMKKFELCYDIEPDRIFLVPDLLPKDEPIIVFNGTPAFEYQYPVLPSSVLTRFIVRMNHKIHENKVWRSGVLLKVGENRALVKADQEDRTVHIAIDGLEHTRRDTLSAIRYQLDEIHASIKGLNPEKYVPVPGGTHAKPLKYEYLLKMERAGKDFITIEDGDGLSDVNISQMLNGVESEYQRKQYGNITNINIGGDANGTIISVGDGNDIQS